MIVKKHNFKKYKQLKGIFADGCVSRGEGSRFRAKAHAHTDKRDVYQGWICVLSSKRLTDNNIMLHELAHIITRQGHTDKWRKCLIDLGGTIEEIPGIQRSYVKKVRTA